MKLEEIMAIIERFDRSTLTGLTLRQGEEKLILTRQTEPTAPAAIANPVPAPAPAAAPVAAAPTVAATPTQEEEGEFVTAPLVGTFYLSDRPGGAPLAPEGAHVKKGQALCVIEAMKMMTEIPAPCDCRIEQVLVENGQLVEFGQRLFAVQEIHHD